MDIKQLRLEIDKYLNTIKYLKSTREVSLAFTALQRSFGWLGEALKAAGSTSPYKDSENPASPNIEPTADHIEESIIEGFWDIEATQLARVKFFRSVIETTVVNFITYREQSETAGRDYDNCLDQSFVSLKDAKMWFGWELARIKKESETIDTTAITTML